MPVVQITLVEGRDPALFKQCVKDVAHAIQQSLGAPLDSIRVMVYQVPAATYVVGDRTRDEIDAEKQGRSGP